MSTKPFSPFAQKIRHGISVAGDTEKGNIVSVSFTSTSLDFAAAIVNAGAAACSAVSLENENGNHGPDPEWMKSNADSERAKLEASERKLRDYKNSTIFIRSTTRKPFFPRKLPRSATA
ncbi:MAG: hypothetical protein R2860_16415 [Desulfobacterales bacterium]